MRRLSLWLNLSTDLNPSQVVSVLPTAVEVTPGGGQAMQGRSRQPASSSLSGNLEMMPDLPGTVLDEDTCQSSDF